MRISGVYRKGFPIFIMLALICLVFPQIVLGSSGESGGGGVTVTPDGSIIIQIVNFLFTIWVTSGISMIIASRNIQAAPPARAIHLYCSPPVKARNRPEAASDMPVYINMLIKPVGIFMPLPLSVR